MDLPSGADPTFAGRCEGLFFTSVIMSILSDLLAPAALLLTAPFTAVQQGDTALTPEAQEQVEASATLPSQRSNILLFNGADVPVQNQVRIERRIVVRITPRSRAPRQDLMASLPRQPLSRSYEEEKTGKCVAVNAIAGVQSTRDDRLLLFLRDRRILTAELEKKCAARDFYSGFYVERNKDGRLCVKRDKLQSRTGANCEVRRWHRLVVADK